MSSHLPSRSKPSPDWRLAAILVGVAVVAATLRLAWLAPRGPGLAGNDEVVMMARATVMYHLSLPDQYDWPTGAPLFLAAAMRGLGWVVRVADPEVLLLLGRTISALAGTMLAMLTGLIAGMLFPVGKSRRWAAGLAGTAMTVAFIAVTTSRLAIPEVQQDAMAATGLAATLRYDTTRSRLWLVGAGAASGLAAGGKYVGGVALLALILSALTAGQPGPRRRNHVGLALVSAAVAFLAVVPGMIATPGKVIAGLNLQLAHSSTGHAGFDSSTPALWYHLTITIPQSIGWFWAVVGYATTLATVRIRNRRWRLVGVFVASTFVVIGTSHLTFPRYALLPLPGVIALAAAALVRIANLPVIRRHTLGPGVSGPRIGAGAVVLLLAVLTLVSPAVSAARAVVASRAQRTELVAATLVATLPGPVYAEPYTLPSTQPVHPTSNLADHPELVHCHCYLVISSEIEDRFRAEPARYSRQLAVYNSIRALGIPAGVIAPSVRLTYRWQDLPRYGMDDVPLTGDSVLGPTISVFRMP